MVITKLENPINIIMNWLMLSCEKAAKLMEKRWVTQLSPSEKIQLKMHSTVCRSCDSYKRQSEIIQKSRILIDHAPIGIALINSIDGAIIDLNSKFAEIAGRTVDEMIGMDWMRITHPDDLQMNLENIASMKNGNVDHFKMEKRFIKADGTIVWIHITIVPIKIGNNIIKKHLAMIEDIADKRQCEIDLNERNIEIVAQNNEYRRINKELIIAKEKAEESDLLKTEFLNNLSHEIRTPLNGIMGFSDLLNMPDLSDAKRKNFVNIIQNSGNQLIHIIDEILEISMLGTKRMTINENQICLNDFLMELFSVFDLKAKEIGIPLYFKKGLLDKNSIIITDSVKLNKIISNLLENALKFTKKGFIEFGYHLKSDTVPAKLSIYVKDTGVGIEKEKQKLIFERFSQGEKELSKKVGGLGLGLSIAKENAELLGGTVLVESNLGEGSTFYIEIPHKPLDIDVEYDTVEDNPSILIVEDEEINYLFLETILQYSINIKCNILHAINGEEAINKCKKHPEIDLVLMDLKMPVLNGFEATKQIKKFRPNLPVIAQTAYSTENDKIKAFSAGCDDFITKPINMKDLEIILTKYIKILKEPDI